MNSVIWSAKNRQRCYWPMVSMFSLLVVGSQKLNTLSIVSVNSVTYACCKHYFCQDLAVSALKMSPVLLLLHSSLTNCQIRNISLHCSNCVVFMSPINFWTFCCESVTHSCKIMMYKTLCGFLLEHPVYDSDYVPKNYVCLYLLVLLFATRYVLLLILLTYSVFDYAAVMFMLLWLTSAVNYLVKRCLVYMECLYDKN